MEFKKIKLNNEELVIPVSVDVDEIEENNEIFEDVNTDLVNVDKVKEAFYE